MTVPIMKQVIPESVQRPRVQKHEQIHVTPKHMLIIIRPFLKVSVQLERNSTDVFYK